MMVVQSATVTILRNIPFDTDNLNMCFKGIYDFKMMMLKY